MPVLQAGLNSSIQQICHLTNSLQIHHIMLTCLLWSFSTPDMSKWTGHLLYKTRFTQVKLANWTVTSQMDSPRRKVEDVMFLILYSKSIQFKSLRRRRHCLCQSCGCWDSILGHIVETSFPVLFSSSVSQTTNACSQTLYVHLIFINFLRICSLFAPLFYIPWLWCFVSIL